MVVKNESEMLSKLFGFVVATGLDVIAVDKGSSDDTVSFLENAGASVISEPHGWSKPAGWYCNRVLKLALEQGFKWTMFLDADEAMWPSDIKQLECLIEEDRIYGFRRFNLGGVNGEKWAPEFYPDVQIRLIPNNSRLVFDESQKVHCLLVGDNPHTLLEAHIFHYKGTRKDKRDMWLRTYEQCCHHSGINPQDVEPTEEQCRTIDSAKYDFQFPHPLCHTS